MALAPRDFLGAMCSTLPGRLASGRVHTRHWPTSSINEASKVILVGHWVLGPSTIAVPRQMTLCLLPSLSSLTDNSKSYSASAVNPSVSSAANLTVIRGRRVRGAVVVDYDDARRADPVTTRAAAPPSTSHKQTSTSSAGGAPAA